MSMGTARDRLIVAIDVADAQRAVNLVRALKDEVRYFKVGLELHSALGPRILELIFGEGARVFLDLKYHDIPSMVERAAHIVTGMGVWGFSAHVMGGARMLSAALNGANQRAEALHIPVPKVLGLTLLTHIDQEALNGELQVPGDLQDRVVWQAKRAKECGLPGCIASPREVVAVREACGPEFTIVTPGIRPSWVQATDDQRRVMTPAEALQAGADYLVVGRPITQSDRPVEMAKRVLDEMEEALS